MTTFVALLRAVNVGGQNKIPMAELRASMTAVGRGDARTYLQSGNIVFDAPGDSSTEQAAAVHQLIEREFGCDVRVLVLAAAELARVAAANPFLPAAGAADEKSLHVTFLEEPAPEDAFGGLTLPAQPGEQARIAASGRVIYLYLSHGYGRTKLNNGYFERHLGVAATTRNWRTVLALAEMSTRYP
jgi:uncharacterized protein (DUF1697 family)